jgi:hypothetical protein
VGIYNRSQLHECGNGKRGLAVSFMGIYKSDLVLQVRVFQITSRSPLMKRFDQSHLHSKLAGPMTACPGRESNPGLHGGRRALLKRAIRTACILLIAIRNIYIWARDTTVQLHWPRCFTLWCRHFVPQSTYFTVRGQSYFSRLPKYWPRPGGGQTRRAERGMGGGGAIFWKYDCPLTVKYVLCA